MKRVFESESLLGGALGPTQYRMHAKGVVHLCFWPPGLCSMILHLLDVCGTFGHVSRPGDKLKLGCLLGCNGPSNVRLVWPMWESWETQLRNLTFFSRMTRLLNPVLRTGWRMRRTSTDHRRFSHPLDRKSMHSPSEARNQLALSENEDQMPPVTGSRVVKWL